jgi:predicted metal-binding protein
MPEKKRMGARNKFQFLKEKALEVGAIEAKIIPADKVFVENRVTLKCRGCVGYGKKLTCPPHVPTPDEFRKILGEYDHALLIKFRSPAETDDDVYRSIYRYWLDPAAPEDKKVKATKFWNDYFSYSKNISLAMLELEKTAFNKGFTFALALVNGSCRFCEKCNVENGICNHPNMARIPEHALGINMKKTAEKAGMPITFPVSGNPTPMALLLIE